MQATISLTKNNIFFDIFECLALANFSSFLSLRKFFKSLFVILFGCLHFAMLIVFD